MAIGNPITLTNNVDSKSITLVATDGQTSFTPSGGYRINNIEVYRNGVRLVDGRDFTARDGVTVTLVTACVLDDVVSFQIFDDFKVSDTINANDSDQTVDGNLNIVGVLSATTLKGDGTNITGLTTGVSINAAGGALQRVMLGNISSGVANTMANTADLYYNNTTSTLYAPNVNVSGTMTQEDVQNVDSTGIVTGGLGLRATKGGVVITAGVSTFTAALDVNSTSDFAGNLVVSSGDLSVTGAPGEVKVGSAVILGKAGVITATSFSGSGANLTDIVSGISLQQAGSWITGSTGNPGGSTPGTAATTFNFASGATLTEVSSGISTISISASLTTEAHIVTTEGVVSLNLGSAQDHKLTASGVTTVTCNGGTEGDSHTLRITNSGVSTVGFATYFLWPSGASPVMPTTDGAISLISFTLQRPGAVGLGTQLLAGASVNYS